MASTSECSQQPKDLQLCDTSCAMGGSDKGSDSAAASLASVGDDATPTTSYFSAVEEQIERSKAHWSTLVDRSGDTDEEEMDFEVSNEREFRALQKHPAWGSFFAEFSGDAKFTNLDNCYGELLVGKKFAEGGQAELYETQIKWKNPKITEDDHRWNREYVLKVFKEGTLLKHVKSQLPDGLLQFHVEVLENWSSATAKEFPCYCSRVYHGILLKNGRPALLMPKQHFDLRTLIERNMELRSGGDQGPFSKEDVELLMYEVALGVNWLHNRDIVHRDLKASNVLVCEFESVQPRWMCLVADFECSVGVVGTNFFRAPEVLEACKEWKVNERPEVFSKAADVYSYGMICYEISTGKLPFEDHPLGDNRHLLIDLVINQHLRPEVPTYVEGWAQELLQGCWQHDPRARPTIGEILNLLPSKSSRIRLFELGMKEKHGKYFKW